MALSIIFLIATIYSAIATCWVNGFTRDFCCDPIHGPSGNPKCWDDVFKYNPCCDRPSSLADTESNVEAPIDFDAVEHALGPKLDLALADAESITDFEESLRRSANSPEDRTMAEPLTRTFLALVLHRQGRTVEAAREIQRGLQIHELNISRSGAWVGTNAAGYHMHDSAFAEALIKFFNARHVRTVVDMGCGLGLYVRDLRTAGIRAGGFDGNPSTLQISEGRCLHADLTVDIDLGTRWGWGMSLEVAEHIPPEFEETFLSNLDRHACSGLVLSWGNQAGEGHVNLRPSSEVKDLFEQRGFRVVEESTIALRQAATLPWLQNTVVVLERVLPLGYTSGCIVA